jgi:hypothetical protein
MGRLGESVLEESEVIEALGALEPVWDELYPAEQAHILRLLIERINVAPDGISITLHAAGIRSLVAELASEQAAALEPSHGALMEVAEYDRADVPEVETLTIRIPNTAAAPVRPQAHHDARGCGGADAEAEPRRDAAEGARSGAPLAA